MAVLAIVIVVAYGTSTRSFHTSIDSQYRDQASSIVKQQVELIKNADISEAALLSTYKITSHAFCINPADITTALDATAPSQPCDIPLSGWGGSGNKVFTVSNTYVSSSQTFRVNINWPSAENRTQTATSYYKPSDSFVACPSSGIPGDVSCVGAGPTQPVATNPPAFSVSLTALPTTVSFSGTTSLKWTLSNVKNTPCTASSNPAGFWSGSFLATSDTSGHASASLTSAGSVVFTLHCIAFDGSDADGVAGVTVNPAPKPIVATTDATAVTYSSATLNGTVDPNGYTTSYLFNYGTSITYGLTTPAVSVGLVSGPVSTSVSISPTTTYHFQICATNTYGTVCGVDKTFTTAALPPPSYPPPPYPPPSYPPPPYPPPCYMKC